MHRVQFKVTSKKLNEIFREKLFLKRTNSAVVMYELYFSNPWHQAVWYSTFRRFERTKQTVLRAINLTTLGLFQGKDAIERKAELGRFCHFY